jgi:5-methylcytosine-specific restriction endonuclease McrA
VSETYVPAELRRRVIARARNRCEYCGIREEDTYFGCEVDHIISEKHGGRTDEANLALACLTCNRAKGSDVATVDDNGNLVELFHPRRHNWAEHFALHGAMFVGLTSIGRATVRLLRLNAPERISEREIRR